MRRMLDCGDASPLSRTIYLAPSGHVRAPKIFLPVYCRSWQRRLIASPNVGTDIRAEPESDTSESPRPPRKQSSRHSKRRNRAHLQPDVPGPRGQITDRNGVALAQNRLSYNLAMFFPRRLFFRSQALSFVRKDRRGGEINRSRLKLQTKRFFAIIAIGESCVGDRKSQPAEYRSKTICRRA
jgi:hypothetical protein